MNWKLFSLTAGCSHTTDTEVQVLHTVFQNFILKEKKKLLDGAGRAALRCCLLPELPAVLQAQSDLQTFTQLGSVQVKGSSL